MSGTSELTGRALDVALAKVFGWTPAPIPPIELAMARAFGVEPRPGPWWLAPEAAAHPELATLDVPHYSRGWAGAGLVVDEMRRRGWEFVVRSVRGRVRAMFSKDRGLDGFWCDSHKDANVGVAVARAAIAALGAET
jgi:hypothetical protein